MDQTKAVIQRVIDAAIALISPQDATAVTSELLAALDAAMTFSYGEGRADERQDWIEKTLRAMNETGQGEHGVTHDPL